MKSNVFFIKNKENSQEYYQNIEKIIDFCKYYDKIGNNKKVLLNINPRDMRESSYINKNTIENIQKNLSKIGCDHKILFEDRLYFYKKNEESINDIIKEHSLNTENIIMNHETMKVYCDGTFEEIPVLKEVYDTENMIVFTHFKTHSMIGFSGAVKNLVTSIIGLKGQEQLHKLVKPFISKIRCLACNVCEKSCPEKVIHVDSYAHINNDLCVGCNVCIETCPNDAIKLNKLVSDDYMRTICEIAGSILNDKKDNKVLFINSLIKIKAYYDCNNNSEKIIKEDLGVLASYNPVALDKACYDLINEDSSEDKFKQLWRNIDGTLQFKYAEELKLGLDEYELITI